MRVMIHNDKAEAILEPLGQTMIRANSGPEALKQVLGDEFAVILLDVQMPGMNGFEVAEIIKSREKSRTIPISSSHRATVSGSFDFPFRSWNFCRASARCCSNSLCR